VNNEAAARDIVRERAGGRCEVRIPEVCQGYHDNTHHRLKAGRIWAPSNLLAVCGSGTTGCHGWIEAHPAHGDGEPAHVPVFLRPVYGPWWYILDDEGLLIMHTEKDDLEE